MDNIGRLELVIDMMVVCARESGSVSLSMMRARLVTDGMSEEEVSLLMEIVQLEVRQQPKAQHKKVDHDVQFTPMG